VSNRVCRNRREPDTRESQTCAPKPGIVTGEGGGFNPTLDLGGGAGFTGISRRRVGGNA
jgi:hypothetical protein